MRSSDAAQQAARQPAVRGTWRIRLDTRVAPRRGKPRWLISSPWCSSVWASCPRPSRSHGRSSTASGSRTTTATSSSSTGNVRLEQLRPGDLDAAPRRTATRPRPSSGWQFLGLEDAQATTSDTAFAGGTKQDDNCAYVITAKAPNKDDLKRVYMSSKDHQQPRLAVLRVGPDPAEHHVGIGPHRLRVQQAERRLPGGGCARPAAPPATCCSSTTSRAAAPTSRRLTLRRWVTTGACEVDLTAPRRAGAPPRT